MQKLTKTLAVTIILFDSLLTCNFASAQESQASVLMLGDSGIHKPSEFYRHLVQPFRDQGIDLRYTEELGDLNEQNLSKYDGLLIFANIEQITPEAESALLSYVNEGGGLTPVHCAPFCFLGSPKYIELVGGQFQSHGFTRFQIEIVAADHPIMAGLKPKHWWINGCRSRSRKAMSRTAWQCLRNTVKPATSTARWELRSAPT